MTLDQLYKVQRKLHNDIKLGIDTEDTWIDLDMVKFAIRELTRIPRNTEDND